VCQLLATLCVAFSLALFALGGTDLTGGFCLQTLRFIRPMVIVGPILDTVVIYCAIEDMICEEQGACKYIRHPLLHSTKHRGALGTIGCPCTPHVLFRLKKGRKSKRERAGIELPYLFYIPRVVEDHAIDFLESVRPGSNYIDHQIWHLPGWGQFVLTFLGLHSL
jgi:hypothetical protein